MIKTYIKRPAYLKKILPYIGTDLIKVIIGQRRVGKSYLLYQIMDEIIKEDAKANIIYINKELSDFDELKNSVDLLKFIVSKTDVKHKNCVFIDEIQDIENFEKALRDLAARKKYDIYCTGSNAKLLSAELASGLSGRSIEVAVHSLSFSEFLAFHNLSKNEESLFEFIKYGGLPYLINLPRVDDVVYDYLKNIYNTIILKDVVARHNIRNVDFLNRLTVFLADNVGSLVSAKKISDFLKSQKIKISPNAVLNYLSYLRAVFFVHEVKRTEIAGKRVFEINEKYYFEDLGLRHALIGYKQVDIAKIVENLVYNQLIFLGYDVSVGQIGDKEIDFVCEKHGQKLYAQATYLISNVQVNEREFGNLLLIKDNYPKIVISMDKMAGGDYKGVKHLHLLDFLTDYS